MSESLAVRTIPTDLVSAEVALEPTPTISFADWTEALGAIAIRHGQLAWAIGDFLVFAEDSEDDDFAEYLSVAVAITGLSEKTLKNHRRVSRLFPPGERHTALKWRHHEIVSGLEKKQDRHSRLKQAERRGWSSTRFERELQERQIGKKRAHRKARRVAPVADDWDLTDRAVCESVRLRALQDDLTAPVHFAVFARDSMLAGRFEQLDDDSGFTPLGSTGSIDESYRAVLFDSRLRRVEYSGVSTVDVSKASARANFCPPALT